MSKNNFFLVCVEENLSRANGHVARVWWDERVIQPPKCAVNF